MAFNSLEYAVFFLVAAGLSWALVRWSMARAAFLLAASYYFYASNNHWLIVLILVSTQIDYGCAIRIADSPSPRARRAFLSLSIATNLSILGFFKYFNFFASSLAQGVNGLGLAVGFEPWSIALPVGISFYTFQSMSYTIDVYRGSLAPERSWIRFALFVAYFPQLVAGPIVRPATFLPQITRRPRLDAEAFNRGVLLIAQGLVKKIVFGDYLALHVDHAFADPAGAGMLACWLGVYAFAFQIYFDFSGYSDIAIGCAKLMGFELPENFRRPYAAVSVSDFWRRWHISLSTWLRDYLYISLGGNRTPKRWGTERNLMLTMLLGGLWHGAAWNFVLWGALHGGLLVAERVLGWRERAERAGGLARSVRAFAIFQLVCLCWIAFRVDSLTGFGTMLTALVTPTPVGSISRGTVLAMAIIAGGMAAQWLGERVDLERRFLALPIVVRGGAYASCVVAVMIFGSVELAPFIYFKF